MPFRAMILLIVAASATAGAQQKFTTQVMIVPAFNSPKRGWGGKAADIVRDRVAGAFSRSELKVISAGDVDDWLRRSGFEQNAELSEGELKELAKKFRADERITAVVTPAAERVRIDALLTPVRDSRLSQPVTAIGATVNEAAESAAKEIIAARRQLIPLRQCENALRSGSVAEAASFAAAAIAAYANAVPARLCLLNTLSHMQVPPDSIVHVAQAVLDIAPANPIALGDLAGALDIEGKTSEAAPVWVRLLATDSSSEDVLKRVVNALSAGGNAAMAQPIIDRGTAEHQDNLELLKLRWLVHLATSDWKGAVEAGEKMLELDRSAGAEPDFYARLARAYREDSQPARALAVAGMGVAKFPKDAALDLVYLQMLRAENDVALARALVAFPDNAEVHVLAAQSLKSQGNAAGALSETKQALQLNPKLPHGFIQVARLEMDAGRPDSAYAAIESAPKYGESRVTAGQTAFALGGTLYKSAAASQKREDFQRAMRFFSLALTLAPSPDVKFYIGASALSISQSAATEASTAKSCDLSKLADESLTEAEINLASGGGAAPDEAKRLLDHLAQLRPYVADEIKSFCGKPGAR
jgi:tetratricopeptide (TPR) repeat protein